MKRADGNIFKKGAGKIRNIRVRVRQNANKVCREKRKQEYKKGGQWLTVKLGGRAVNKRNMEKKSGKRWPWSAEIEENGIRILKGISLFLIWK